MNITWQSKTVLKHGLYTMVKSFPLNGTSIDVFPTYPFSFLHHSPFLLDVTSVHPQFARLVSSHSSFCSLFTFLPAPCNFIWSFGFHLHNQLFQLFYLVCTPPTFLFSLVYHYVLSLPLISLIATRPSRRHWLLWLPSSAPVHPCFFLRFLSTLPALSLLVTSCFASHH